MSERTYRLILGISLLLILFIKVDVLIYGYMALLLFEGVTNYRVPILVNMVRFGKSARYSPQQGAYKIDFEAERVARLLVFVMLLITFVVLKDAAWFFPWFLGFMLALAGITNLCPMIISLRWIGFK
jgi:hypothetical protein